MSLSLSAHNNSAEGGFVALEAVPSRAVATTTRSSANETLTQFRQQNRVTPEAAKMAQIAGRLNASRATDQEYADLLEERQALVEKELAGTLTQRQGTRLTYVRWSLDRIEDARYGASFDELEARVAELEKFSEEVAKLHDDFQKVGARKR